MPELDLNARVLDKLANITQLASEIRQIVTEERPAELPAIDAPLTRLEDTAHRLSRQLSQVPLGTPRH